MSDVNIPDNHRPLLMYGFQAKGEQPVPQTTHGIFRRVNLSESALCDAFALGSMHIRRSLLLLASRELVNIISNKGAFVATPSAKQARDMLQARLAIGPMVARDHCEILSVFESGDGERAAALMTDHLEHMKSQMNLDQSNASTLDLTQIFARQ